MHGSSVSRFSRNGMLFSVAVITIAVCGCGGGSTLPEGETGTVRGKVTYNGKAVPAGSSIVFVHETKGIPATGTISASGDYSLKMKGASEILTGKYKIGVTPPASAQSEMSAEEAMRASVEGKTEPPKEWPEIPEKYRTPETSGETFDVKAGANEYNLDMKN